MTGQDYMMAMALVGMGMLVGMIIFFVVMAVIMKVMDDRQRG